MFDELFPILSTPDLARALGFYRDLLGCEVTYRFPPADPDGGAEPAPVFVSLGMGGSTLGIGQREAGAGETVNDRITLWVYASDCDAAVARLRAAGVTVVAEPVDQPWGERMATVLDPDGTAVIVASRSVNERRS